MKQTLSDRLRLLENSIHLKPGRAEALILRRHALYGAQFLLASRAVPHVQVSERHNSRGARPWRGPHLPIFLILSHHDILAAIANGYSL